MLNQWVDVHAHFTPPMTAAESEARWKSQREGCFMVPEPYVWTVEKTLEYMDRTVDLGFPMLLHFLKPIRLNRCALVMGRAK